MKEFTMKFLCFLAVSCVSLFGSGMQSKVFGSTVDPYAGNPFFGITAETNSLKSALVTGTKSHIPFILNTGSDSQVSTSVIQPVSVLMVNLESLRESHDLTMHADSGCFSVDGRWNRAHGIKLSRFVIPLREPSESAQRFEVGGIDNRHLALRERNSAVFLYRLKVQRRLVHEKAPRKAVSTSAILAHSEVV